MTSTPDFDDELSFNELIFGDDTDPDDQPVARGKASPVDHHDEGYNSMPSSRTARHGAVLVPQRSVGSRGRPRGHRHREGAASYADTQTADFGAPHMLSPQAASSPRIRTRPRSRSRSEHMKRDSGGFDSRVAVVRGLKSEGQYQEFQQQARSKFGESILRIVGEETDTFAFVECKDGSAARRLVTHFNGSPIGSGVLLQAETCRKVTPGQDPVEYEKYGERSEILVLKNLPFTSTEAELSKFVLEATSCPPPVDFTARRTAAGTFSGMAFVRYTNVASAEAACRALDGVTIGDREIRVEFKRPEHSPRKPMSASPDKPWKRDKSPNEDRSQRSIEEKLRVFLARDDASMDFPASLSSSLRKHVHNTAAALGLEHTSERLDAGLRFVRVRKAGTGGGGDSSPSPSARALSPTSSTSSMEERVFETATPASIRNDIRGGRLSELQQRDRRRTSSGTFSSNLRRSNGGSRGGGSESRAGLRPRANTVSSASGSVGVHAPTDVLRTPRGPDGTRGFQTTRSAAKAC
eukprot:m.440319 g.440319  ORF g.440319 m.440319 type:complete len:523 (-) comp18504_c0_seq1:1875-3443(-)